MNNQIVIDLDDSKLLGLSQDSLAQLLGSKQEVHIKIPLPSVGSSNSYIDLVSDYLDASYVVETIASIFNCTALEEAWKNDYFPYYILKVTNFSSSALARKIIDIIWAFQHPEGSTEQEFKFLEVREEIYAYESTIADAPLRFPEIIDNYFANLVYGAYYELDFEGVSDDLSRFPERWFGYWYSAEYNGEPSKVLMSVDTWIVPNDISIEDAFNRLGYEGDCSLLHAQLLTINSRSVVVSEGTVLGLPMGKLVQALACLEEVHWQRDEYSHKFQWGNDIFEPRSSYRKYQANPSSTVDSGMLNLGIYASEFSDFIVVQTKLAQIVMFDVKQIRKRDAERFIHAARELISSIDDELQIAENIEIPWQEIDDEIFEQLCYEVIYRSSKFDRNTIRKMGKSRSRDGGRDIVVNTHPKPGEKPLKYIFQCKHSNPSNSINTSNVGSVSDVIDQYGAHGYGLMCSCFIDSTLYDRLDAISSNRQIEIETWSKFELERFIARRPMIKGQFFGVEQTHSEAD